MTGRTGLGRCDPAFSFKRIPAEQRREGVEINHKRVWRIYQQAGLAVRRKRLVREGRPREAANAVNEEWALDFVSDALAPGRSVRVLSCITQSARARSDRGIIHAKWLRTL